MFGVIVDEGRSLQRAGYQLVENETGDKMQLFKNDKIFGELKVTKTGELEFCSNVRNTLAKSFFITQLESRLVIVGFKD